MGVRSERKQHHAYTISCLPLPFLLKYRLLSTPGRVTLLPYIVPYTYFYTGDRKIKKSSHSGGQQKERGAAATPHINLSVQLTSSCPSLTAVRVQHR